MASEATARAREDLEDPKPKLTPSIAAAVVSVLLYPAIVLAGFYLLPKDPKDDLTKILVTSVNALHGWATGIQSPTGRLFTIAVYSLSLVFGIGTLLYLEFRRFRGTQNFEIPYFGKALQLKPITNVFYDEGVVKTPTRVKELASQVREFEKDLNSTRQALKTAEADREKFLGQLQELTDASSALESESQQYIGALQELYNLMGHITVLINCDDSVSYLQEFTKLMDEVSNTIIRVTADRGNDKYSSIMMVNPNRGVLQIVGSNGLSHQSRSRTFTLGQGFAGWIWKNKQPAVCSNIAEDPRFNQPGCEPSGPYRSMVGVPIMGFNQEVIGALFVQSRRQDAFDQTADPAILSYFARLLALCMTDKLRKQFRV